MPLERVLGDEIGAVCADMHRDHGVDLRLATGVERLRRRTAGSSAFVLADGAAIDADVVVVGVGVDAEHRVARGLGPRRSTTACVCDATCLAAPGVVAAGDVARWPNGRSAR